ncbi:MarR family winged helix-turn-helix transcriptional regulator [Streptomyces sp. NBC_00259]|uniref:MarR family winged helix-turn-helix transcriptional regulator n=1 Tax=Streptomyces sp. NBC_00259 TaxID=2903643 RepID=UPI002E2C368B|nr:MarR family winged helix-turn-helix transcriptional regulator [Streptomyces sp. NBC_00259]
MNAPRHAPAGAHGGGPHGRGPAASGPSVPPSDRDEVATRLRTAVLRLSHGLRAPAERHDLTPSRLTALGVLSAHGPLRIGDLARGMSITMPSASRLVDILVAADLVSRRSDPHDQRACLLELTPTGTAVLDSVRRESTQALAGQLAMLPEDQLATLAAALPQLDRLAQQLTPGEPQPSRKRHDRREPIDGITAQGSDKPYRPY